MTLSVFVLSGPQLKASVSLEGPFAGLDVESGPDLHAKIIEFTNGEKSKKLLFVMEDVDFEHLNEILDDDTADTHDDGLMREPILGDDPDAEMKRMERRAKQRKRYLDNKQRKEERKLAQLKKVRQEGEPFIYTAKAPVAGWYRVCVHSNWNQASLVTQHHQDVH